MVIRATWTLAAASVAVGCSAVLGIESFSPATDGGAADGTTVVGQDATAGGGSDSGSGSGSSGGSSSGSSGGDDGGCVDGGCSSPPRSCPTFGAGLTNCGESSESCCTSLPVPGGPYFRTYTNAGSSPTMEADTASVSGFRLDKYLVTVGRFRKFVSAWNGGTGWLPAPESGKHTYLNGGAGLVNVGSSGGSEPGWVMSDDSDIAPTDTNLACNANYVTWTPSAGNNEILPINCVNWWEAYAFCIWDGGFLPSEAEWEYAAAGGSDQLEYPWGTAAPGASNDYAIYGCNYPPMDSGSTCNVAPVGTATQGGGRWGQLDLSGDVWEWNLDSYATYANPCMDCANLTPGAAQARVLRGGVFFNAGTSDLLPPNRNYDPPTSRNVYFGFRCARSP